MPVQNAPGSVFHILVPGQCGVHPLKHDLQGGNHYLLHTGKVPVPHNLGLLPHGKDPWPGQVMENLWNLKELPFINRDRRSISVKNQIKRRLPAIGQND